MNERMQTVQADGSGKLLVVIKLNIGQEPNWTEGRNGARETR